MPPTYVVVEDLLQQHKGKTNRTWNPGSGQLAPESGKQGLSSQLRSCLEVWVEQKKEVCKRDDT
jgi:hypothetical protein